MQHEVSLKFHHGTSRPDKKATGRDLAEAINGNGRNPFGAPAIATRQNREVRLEVEFATKQAEQADGA
jgi:hypothetical protein